MLTLIRKSPFLVKSLIFYLMIFSLVESFVFLKQLAGVSKANNVRSQIIEFLLYWGITCLIYYIVKILVEVVKFLISKYDRRAARDEALWELRNGRARSLSEETHDKRRKG